MENAITYNFKEVHQLQKETYIVTVGENILVKLF